MNNYLIIKVTNHIQRFIRKCYEHNISLYNINYVNEEQIIIKININDYKKIKRLNYYSKIIILKYEGIYGFKYHLKKYLFTHITIILCFALMDVLTSYIVKIDIIHENSNIRALIKEELSANNINTFMLAKDFEELEIIKNKILENNQTKLEWLSITRYGMTYVIRAEERIITDISKEEGFANIISKKDALITKIVSDTGSVQLRSGDYVKKGDVIISGEIKLFDNTKGHTLASGEVYGNVWYQTEIKYPLDYSNKTYTGKKRFNISFNNRIFFRNKYQYFEQKNVKKITVLGMKISFYTEVEYQLDNGKYTLKEAENLALKEIDKKMLKKIGPKGTIISKKVLKKEEINSTISMSVFVVANELISEVEYYTPGSDENDTENSD